MVNFGKFVHTKTGKIIMSILLGFGLATLFRKVCEHKNCMFFYAPPLENFKNKVYKLNNKCVKYVPIATKCTKEKKTILFE